MNLKIKFDVFIEIRGRSTPRRVAGAYIRVIPHVGAREPRGFNSAVTNDGS